MLNYPKIVSCLKVGKKWNEYTFVVGHAIGKGYSYFLGSYK